MSKDPAFLFSAKDWNTPNTYDVNFMIPPDEPGVYLIVLPSFICGTNYDEVVYVGSAKSLQQRYKGHEVIRFLRETYGYVQFFFKIDADYRNTEKNLIRTIQPKYNKQWR